MHLNAQYFCIVMNKRTIYSKYRTYNMHIMRIIYAESRQPLTTKAPLKDYMQDRHFTSKTRCAVFLPPQKGSLPRTGLSETYFKETLFSIIGELNGST